MHVHQVSESDVKTVAAKAQIIRPTPISDTVITRFARCEAAKLIIVSWNNIIVIDDENCLRALDVFVWISIAAKRNNSQTADKFGGGIPLTTRIIAPEKFVS